MFVLKNITFKNGETERVGDLGYAVQWNPVSSIKIAVLDFVKEGIYPIETHWTGQRSKKKDLNN